ncbi:uncharacterized protein LOC112189926 [Rosa chinensis]|uniref:uncharacterized protein LOC112189926 n=1 Tax=Rosa chinensis TaxID=74649 RepID=UPI000D089364|nr:uncharacterized protein LOC112189926 [Rosa chinensis]
MMKQHLHGTTNVGFVFGEGIMLGSGAIITTSNTDEGGTECNELLSDQEVTIFQLCSKPKIYCTLMGDVKEWHEMYRHLLELEPQSVRASFDCAKKYLNDFLKKNRRSGNSFGTIIAGYHKEEGFQILGVSLDKKKVREYTDREFSIGSGGFFADLVLLKTNADGYANMTKEVAVNVAFEALLQGSLKDYCSGGILRVTYVHKDGCIFITYRVLDVYKTLYKTLYDSADKEEQATLFLLYSTSFGPIFRGDNIQALISDIWSGGLKSIIHSNIIAKKACFYVHRIVLKDEEEAIKAYDDISTKNARPIYPQALAHIRSYLIDCVREKTREHVYIGRSSKELLEGICMLKDADTLKYQ